MGNILERTSHSLLVFTLNALSISLEKTATRSVNQQATVKMVSTHATMEEIECVLRTTMERNVMCIANQQTVPRMDSIRVIVGVVESVLRTTMEKSAKCFALQKTVTNWDTIRVPVMVAESVWRDTRVGTLERAAQSVFLPQAAVSVYTIPPSGVVITLKF